MIVKIYGTIIGILCQKLDYFMSKYWSLLKLFWSTSLSAELEYRLNFILATFTSIANLIGGIFGLSLFYNKGYNFAGWNWQSALLVLGIFTCLQGISMTFLFPNLNKIVEQVEKGTLDFILLKPINSQFWVSFRSISPWGVPDLLLGGGLIVYSGILLKFSLLNYLLGIIPILFGVIIVYSLWFILAATSIWFVKIYNVTEVLRGLLDAGRFPINAYPVGFRFFFTFIIPIIFLTTIPAQVMLGNSQFFWVMGSGCLAFFLLFFSQWFWTFALRFYTSASS